MSLIKTSVLNGLAVVIKVLTTLLLNKVFAVYLGPSGYAIIGQLQNVVSIFTSLGGGVLSIGVTKLTAEVKDDHDRQKLVWQTSARLAIVASFVLGLLTVIMSKSLSNIILNDSTYSEIFILLGLSLPAIALNNVFLAILNGRGEIYFYVISNISGSFIILFSSALLCVFLGLYGVLISLVVNPVIMLVATSVLMVRSKWFRIGDIWGKCDRSVIAKLGKFGLMGVTSAIAIPSALIFMRGYIADSLGMIEAGYWQASWKISEIYLMLITTTLAVYYLPRLAEIKNPGELKSEILKVYSFVMPLVVLGAATIYFLRSFIINVLLSPDFSAVENLFFWQLLGDVIKIGSWILAYVMFGRTMMKSYIITEVLFALAFCCLFVLFVGWFGTVGAGMAYSVNYAIYWLVMWLIVGSEVKKMMPMAA